MHYKFILYKVYYIFSVFKVNIVFIRRSCDLRIYINPFNCTIKIPSTLESIWNQVSKDKEVTVEDLNALIKAAMPTGKSEELDDDERKFINDLTRKMIDGNGTLKM